MVIFQTTVWHCKTNTFFPWNKKTVAVSGHSDLIPLKRDLSFSAGNRLGKSKQKCLPIVCSCLQKPNQYLCVISVLQGECSPQPSGYSPSISDQSLCCMRRSTVCEASA